MTPEETIPEGHLWAVHSSKDNKPVLRAWAVSESAAEARAAALQVEDTVKEDAYWVTRLMPHQIEALKGNGFIPADA